MGLAKERVQFRIAGGIGPIDKKQGDQSNLRFSGIHHIFLEFKLPISGLIRFLFIYLFMDKAIKK